MLGECFEEAEEVEFGVVEVVPVSVVVVHGVDGVGLVTEFGNEVGCELELVWCEFVGCVLELVVVGDHGWVLIGWSSFKYL